VRRALIALAVAGAVVGGCGKKQQAAPHEDPNAKPPPMSAAEVTRNADACKDYVAQACACADAHPDKPDVVDQCKYDKALPDALALGMATAENPASTRNDVILAQSQARKIVAQCIEQLAKLPAMGCQ